MVEVVFFGDQTGSKGGGHFVGRSRFLGRVEGKKGWMWDGNFEPMTEGAA
tara:strand:- start:31 stop:180 length:150 start_codon:yes stop_codon:yes gene_type:complete